jgi:acyl-CoA oxidase
MKEHFMQDFERDPLFKMDDIHDISKDELRERTMEKVYIEKKKKKKSS